MKISGNKIFSVKNVARHKELDLCGLKIKFKTHKSIIGYYEKKIQELNQVIQNQQSTIEQKESQIQKNIEDITQLSSVLKLNAIPDEDIRLIPEDLQEKFAMDHFGITVRKNTSDIPVVYDVLQKKVYACTNTSFDVNIIVDAGANIGCASIYYAQRYPNATIYALEPEKENYQLLVKNVSKYPNIIPLNIGLWGRDCAMKVVDNGNGAWGYQVSDNGNMIGEIECCTINSLMKKFKIKKIDILKIDIEGAEKNVFEHTENIDFAKIDMISIELHDRMEPGCSNAFFNAIVNHPEYELDYVYTENLVFRKQNINKEKK